MTMWWWVVCGDCEGDSAARDGTVKADGSG